MELYQLKFFSISLAPECTVQSQVFRIASKHILLLLAESLVNCSIDIFFQREAQQMVTIWRLEEESYKLLHLMIIFL